MKIKLENSTQAFFKIDNATYAGYPDIETQIKKSKQFSVDDTSFGFYLRLGFIPPPYSGIKNIERLSFLSQDNTFDIKSIAKNFPYYHKDNDSPQDYVPEDFEEKINNIIRNKINKESKYLLMLSGGKDSTSILLSLATMGFTNIICATYVSGIKENESFDAKTVCEALGYTHYVVKQDFKIELALTVDCLKNSISPVGDPALPPYLKTIYEISKYESFDSIIDGMGNDIYMGHIASKNETRLQFFSLPSIGLRKLWGATDFAFINKYLSYLTQSILMYKSERYFSGSRLSIKNIKNMSVDTIPLKKYILELESSIKGLEFFNARALIRGGLYDDFSGCEKARIAANHFKKEIVFPFLDQDFAEYYLSLDEKWKFDRNNRINKVALREFINLNFKKKEIPKNEYLSKKGSFRFNVELFVKENLDEIIFLTKKTDEVTKGRHQIYSTLIILSKKTHDYTATLQIYLIFTWCIWLLGVNEKGVEL